MKLVLAAMLILFGACKKSEPTQAKPSEPAPTATERAGDTGSGAGSALPGNERRARMMKDLDTNGDGVISDEERATGKKKRIERMRARLDTNGDGKLTPDELAAATGRMKFDNPAELDTNKDGDISVDELEVALQARRDSRGSGDATAPE